MKPFNLERDFKKMKYPDIKDIRKGDTITLSSTSEYKAVSLLYSTEYVPLCVSKSYVVLDKNEEAHLPYIIIKEMETFDETI
jgi:hypothetical protein